jgi:hypothetical protein
MENTDIEESLMVACLGPLYTSFFSSAFHQLYYGAAPLWSS